MAIDMNRVNERRKMGILAGGIILSIAAGLIVWQGAHLPWLSFIYTILAVIGAVVFIMSFFKSGEMDLVPSNSSYYMVTGYLLLVIGILGIVSLTVNMELWIIYVILIALIAAMIIIRSISKKG